VAFSDSKADFPEPLLAPEGAPNVLIIVGDDIGYGHHGAFGGPARTPTFDRVAKRGLKYTNFHVAAVCAASRACLLTGRNAHSVGMGVTSTGFPGKVDPAPRDQGRLAPLRAELLPPLPTGGPTRAVGRLVDDALGFRCIIRLADE
jgi:hypothetical protein